MGWYRFWKKGVGQKVGLKYHYSLSCPAAHRLQWVTTSGSFHLAEEGSEHRSSLVTAVNPNTSHRCQQGCTRPGDRRWSGGRSLDTPWWCSPVGGSLHFGPAGPAGRLEKQTAGFIKGRTENIPISINMLHCIIVLRRLLIYNCIFPFLLFQNVYIHSSSVYLSVSQLTVVEADASDGSAGVEQHLWVAAAQVRNQNLH